MDTHPPCAIIHPMELIVIFGIGIIIFLQVVRPSISGKKQDDEKLNKEVGSLNEQLSKERSAKDELSGKSKELFARYKDLEADAKAVQYERDDLKKRVSDFEARQESREKELEDNIVQLNAAKKSLAEERERVIREDEERQKQALETRDRIWAEHENTVVSLLSDICKKPQYQFTTYDNNDLPEGFDGKFKPDFMIDFLGQYIVFDAKVSRSQDIKIYIREQVKKTAEKAKGRSDIYASIFLVVPTDAISMLKEHIFFENGFTFFIVSPEGLAPIISSLKKITNYELAEQFDPQERENIVNLIAKLDYHVNERNAWDIMMAQKGVDVIEDVEKLHPELMQEVELKKSKMRLPTFKSSDIKRLISSKEERKKVVQELTKPRAAIDLNK